MDLRIKAQGKNRTLDFDTEFKLTSTHKFIFNFARERGGIFNREDYQKHLQSGDIDPKMQKQMMVWNQTSLKKLESAGYVKNIGAGKYELVDMAIAWSERPKPRADFKLGKNHIKLLEKHTEGVIKSADLKREHKDKPKNERERQAKMIDGMISNLVANGHLTYVHKGLYKLNENSLNAVAQIKAEKEIVDTVREIKKEQPMSKVYELKITDYDRHILAVADNGGSIRPEFIEAHERCDSIKKRIVTLTKAGLIKDGKITPDLEKRILAAAQLKRSKTLTPELLTRQQKQVLDDIRIFMNLSPNQIAKHIYKGDSALFSADISLLLRQGILEKNTTYGVYLIGKNGNKLLRKMNPDLPIFKSKAYTKTNELAHDVLVYTAFKDVEKKIVQDGGKIVKMLNDRMMRSEDMKELGCMRGKGEYPDLRVVYTDRLGTERVHDIEIDCGYDAKTIGQKISAFFKSSDFGSFSWCCNSIGQACKVAGVAGGDKSRQLKKHKPLYISYVDEKGNVKRLKWS